MKKSILTLCLCAFGFAAVAQEAAPEKSWYLLGDRFYVGKKATTVYRPENTPLKGETDIKGSVYYWQDYGWVGEELQLQKTDTGWVSTITVPKNATLVAYKYYAGEKTDNGRCMYTMMTVDKKGRNLPSSYIGWALLRGKNTQDYSVPNFMTDSTDMWIDDVVLRFWLNQELKYNPGERKNLFPYAVAMLHRTNPEGNKERIRQEIDYIRGLDKEEKLPEIYLYRCLNAANKYLRDKELANELEAEILKRFPKGILARDKEIARIYAIRNDVKTQEADLDKLLKRFPPKKFEGVETDMDNFYGQLYRMVVYTDVIENKGYDKMYKYLDEIPVNMLGTFYWHLVQIPFKNKQNTSQELLPHARALMDAQKNCKRTGYTAGYTQSEWEQHLLRIRKDAYLAYANMLYDCDCIDEAAALAEQLKVYYGTQTTDFNELYVKTLAATGCDKEVIPYIKECVKVNAASPEMIALLRADYVAANGDEKGFDDYLDDMKSDEVQKALKARVMKEMREPTPIKLYEVETLEGGRIDMGELKGKIIVLDFWATWCAPCKAAMPGMQMAVDKYKDDDDVRFFFISTMEGNPNFKEQIVKFIKEKGFNFQVVFDEPNPNNEKGQRDLLYETYGRQFRFSGIPQKLIIDGNGNLCWISCGYYGSPSALCDEISFVIEYLKKGKQYQ